MSFAIKHVPGCNGIKTHGPCGELDAPWTDRTTRGLLSYCDDCKPADAVLRLRSIRGGKAKQLKEAANG